MAFTRMYQATPVDSALPRVPGVTLWAAPGGAPSRSAGTCWADAAALDDGRVVLSAGEAGSASAAAVAAVRAALRTAHRAGSAAALRRANTLLTRRFGGTIVAALHGILDPVTLAFTYASAGHAAPTVRDAAGNIRTLPGSGIGAPLGVFADCKVADMFAPLEPASTMLLATEGGDLLAAYTEPTLEQVDATLAAVPASAPHARTALRRFVAALGLPADRAFEMVLAAGEAVANAIEHAYAGGGTREQFVLRARRDHRRATVTVEDYGRWRSGERTLERGRGLEIMYALADHLDIEETPHGTRVHMSFDVQPCRAVS